MKRYTPAMAAGLDSLMIAPMTAEDIDDVVLIDAASFKQARDAAEPATIATDSKLKEELARPWARLWVARSAPGEKINAFLIAWHVVDELHILNVATHPAARRRGIATALMNHAVAFARAEDVRHVLLEVRRSNQSAIQLYRRLGFFAMALRKKYYTDDEDAVEMVLLFDPTTKAIVARPDEVRLEG